MKDINMLEISRRIDENDVDIWKKRKTQRNQGKKRPDVGILKK